MNKRSRRSTHITSSPLQRALLLLCTLAVSLGLAAQDAKQHRHIRYALEVLGTLGGIDSETHGLSDSGSMAGQSLLSNDLVLHAFFWQKGVLTDLGTLGGPDSFVNVGNHTLNENDEIAGFSETSTLDPNQENFCNLAFANNRVCLAFAWANGVMTPLPTLGGTNGLAMGINKRGQIVGQAEGPNIDPCSPFALEVSAVVWRDGRIEQVLPPFGGTVAVANAINDNEQAVGLSGCASTGNVYAVLWNHGTPIDLGGLGGVTGNVPFDINNKGQVVGQSDLPGDTVHHAFLWQNGVMVDLGSLPGLPISLANGINNNSQVVGFSQNVNDQNDLTSVAWLWDDGKMIDLNTVIPAGSDLFLMEASAINDRGEIAGWGRLANGDILPFLLIPCDERRSDTDGCQEIPKQKH